MKIIDFQIVKERNNKKKKNSEFRSEMRNEIRNTAIYIGLEQYKLAIDKLEKIYNKYKNKCDDPLNYIDLYRFLGESYMKIKNEHMSKKYFNKMKFLIDEYEENLLSSSPHTYILGLKNYYNGVKYFLSKKEKVNINKKILNCAKENNFSSDIVLSSLRIQMLEEQYIDAIDSLDNLHNSDKLVAMKELKELKIEVYNENIELDKINYKNLEMTNQQ